jgi:hypothetical protein
MELLIMWKSEQLQIATSFEMVSSNQKRVGMSGAFETPCGWAGGMHEPPDDK